MLRSCAMVMLVALSMVLTPHCAAQVQWSTATHKVVGRSLTNPALTNGVEIYGKDGVITIRTTRRLQVRVFTILGQLVSQATLNPGTSQLRLNVRGIYIVKADDFTQKVPI